MSESFPTHYAGKKQPPGDSHLMRHRKLHSIVPRESVAGTALVLVVAIMAFLASLTLGAVSLVNDTARSWQKDIAREITIQVKPVTDIDLEAAVESVRQIAESFDGVRSASVVGQEALSRMLEPWLGAGLDLNELPVPRLVTVVINDSSPPNIEALRAKIVESVPGATLDDHRAWMGRLATMARATILIGVFVFTLMMAATILTVVFATRGAMAGNQHVIEVLHFVGAEQSFIAGQFQKHFLLLGLKGALTGGLLALAGFVGVGFWSGRNIADPTSDQMTALFGTFSVGLSGYAGTLILIFVIAMLTAVTSRFTVYRYVGALESEAKPGESLDF